MSKEVNPPPELLENLDLLMSLEVVESETDWDALAEAESETNTEINTEENKKSEDSK